MHRIRLIPGSESRQKKKRMDKAEIRRKNVLKCRYGLITEAYDEILKLQYGVCRICCKKNVIKNRLIVDHNHKTGRLRGLLCVKCNSGLGMFCDSKELLSNAIWYLELEYAPIPKKQKEPSGGHPRAI